MDRRDFLKGFVGCTAAANPYFTPIAMAGSPDSNRLGDKRLVVIVLRGAMDGLDVIQPYGDPNFGNLRQLLGGGPKNGAIDLDGFYAMHPALAPLMPLWSAGELGFAHATSTPYRDKRSHFDGQDLLEAGTAGVPGKRHSGWMNRLLTQVPGLEAETAYALGLEKMAILTGDAPVSDWSPNIGVTLSSQGQRFLDLVMHEDSLFQSVTAEALDILNSVSLQSEDGQGTMIDDTQMMMDNPSLERFSNGATAKLADFAANRLRRSTRIVAFSLGGWDTHRSQHVGIKRALGNLSLAILRLKAGLGAEWKNTAVVAMTEFGRTAKENGSLGTDHGTGSAAFFAGGAINGSRVLGKWPGLAEADLYARRDLMPTRDVRAYAAWMLRGLYGFDQSLIENVIFPGLEMGSDPNLIL